MNKQTWEERMSVWGCLGIVERPRIIVWFSCGAASACAAKIALDSFSSGQQVEIVYCNTSINEHPDNLRFIADCEKWLGVPVKRIFNHKYKSVEEVFDAKQYISGPRGAPCTAQLKKMPRLAFSKPEDVHVFGYTSNEQKRICDFELRNPELNLLWVLRDHGKTKQDCFQILADAGIELPMMYKLGYRNNNCMGCVKSTSPGYWQKVRKDFPLVFESRAKQSRAIGCKLVELHGVRIFLDELPDEPFPYKGEDLPCGPECGLPELTLDDI